MFFESSSSESARSPEPAAEQQPLLQDGRNRGTVGDGLCGPGLRPKAAEHIALKVVAVMYCWFTTGMHVAAIGVRSKSPTCSAIWGVDHEIQFVEVLADN